MGPLTTICRTVLAYVIFSSLLLHAIAQSQSTSTTASTSQSFSLSQETSVVTTSTTIHSANSNIAVSTVFTSVFNATITPSPTSASATISASSSASASATPTPIVLATVIDPAFGVLGALLVISGLPSAFWGHKNRWSSFFIVGFYTLALVCFVLITNFGILPAINPPSKTLRGLFVLACAVAGIAGGGICIFFWKATQYFVGAWGGFVFALFLQCVQNGGLVKSISLRWIYYIVEIFLACAAVGFVLCTLPKIHYHIMLVSTAFVGATAFMLGVDCFTTAGLKEFYVWNLGFKSLFPKFVNKGIEFPVSQTMQIELGLMAAVALMGIAVQLRILIVLQHKLEEIKEEQRKRDQEANVEHTERFAAVIKEREEWEKEHPTLAKHGRHESGLSSMPLMMGQEGSESPTLQDPRPRYHSGVSDFFAAPTPDDEMKRVVRNQSPGALPALDLGLGIEEDVPRTFIADDPKETSGTERKDSLLDEIQSIRRSIDLLKSESSTPPLSSRRPSLNSRRTLSIDAGTSLTPAPASQLRPPRESNPRDRVRSMELSTFTAPSADTISRPTSVPLRDNDWDAYLHDRKLIQPPSGISPPITTTTMNNTVAQRVKVPQSVTAALKQRKMRESAMMDRGEGSAGSSDRPLSSFLPKSHQKKPSASEKAPITILPPQKIASPTPHRPEANRTKTFEELAERHREKMHGMQAPVTQHEKERADLNAAKERWERSVALERNAVTKRQHEKAEILEKKRRQEAKEKGRSSTDSPNPQSRHSRSLSADKLATMGSSSKRLSTMKVQDWQRYQEEAGEMGQKSSKRDSLVPFPGRVNRGGDSTDKRRG